MRRTVSILSILFTAAAISAWMLLDDAGARLPGPEPLRMYLIMPDRFDDGDPENNAANGVPDHSDPLAVQGGDLAGIERRLPYLRALGVNAVWITPVQQNVPGAFHGYWIQHFKRVDPHLGTMEDLQRLIRRAHEMEMRVYLDVVCNHTGPLIGTKEGGWQWNAEGYTLVWRDSTELPTPAVLQDLSLYHNFGEVKEWSDPYQVVGELPGGLDDFRTQDPRVLKAMIDIWIWWMEQTGCDGFRVDTVKHVDMPFWYAWLAAIRRHAHEMRKPEFFIFGEVLSANDAKAAYYTQPAPDGRRGFDAVFNFSIAEAVRDVFGRGRSITRILNSLDQLHLYDARTRPYLLNFIDNHDISRFLAVADGDTLAMRNALTFIHGLQGVPLLYYGTEQSFRGGIGPDWENRESMFAGGWGNPSGNGSFDTTSGMFRHIADLNRIRAGTPALGRGSMHLLFADTARGVLVIERRIAGTAAFVLSNTGDTPAEVVIPWKGRMFPWPDQLALHREGRKQRVELPAQSVHYLLPH